MKDEDVKQKSSNLLFSKPHVYAVKLRRVPFYLTQNSQTCRDSNTYLRENIYISGKSLWLPLDLMVLLCFLVNWVLPSLLCVDRASSIRTAHLSVIQPPAAAAALCSLSTQTWTVAGSLLVSFCLIVDILGALGDFIELDLDFWVHLLHC